MAHDFHLVRSTPSIVETSFRLSPVVATLSHLLKAPWWVLRQHWGYVGGWEVVVKRIR